MNEELRAKIAKIQNRQYDREITIAEAIEQTMALMASDKQRLLEEANKVDGCPCLLVEPCSNACSCANPFMSGGCARCAKYGSKEQRLNAAKRLAQLADNSVIQNKLEGLS